MCDTLALRRGGAAWFAKNSDREAGEPQRVEVREPVRGDPTAKLKCTYIEIDQAPNRRGVILSRPDWMWGAEMGVNDAGVAIGNEAVFSKSMLKRGEALLGMDILRLGLERSASASEAIDVMTDLLEKYGQGGGAGYRDRKFRYDNSFLVADAHSIFVLETAGRDWAVKEARDEWSISNSYTLHADYDHSSLGPGADFKAIHETFAMPRLACAAARRSATMRFAQHGPKDMTLAALAEILRRHDGGDGFDKGSNRDICMHAAGPMRPHATTASMIACLRAGAPPQIAFTGTLHPCISLFKPIAFGSRAWTLCSESLAERGAEAAKRAKREPAWRDAIRNSIMRAELDLLSEIENGRPEISENIASEWVSDWLSGRGRD